MQSKTLSLAEALRVSKEDENGEIKEDKNGEIKEKGSKSIYDYSS